MLDQCRTTPALVLLVDGDGAVLAPPLVWTDAARLGPRTPRDVRWRDDGLAFVAAPQPGDWVSLHWDFVCDRLTRSPAARLAFETRRTLAAVNRAAGGLPAGAG